MEPKTELEALLAVEIAAIGFAGHKFLRQSQHHLDEIYIERCCTNRDALPYDFFG